MRCPHVYPDGRRCEGYIKELEWIKSWGPYALLDEKYKYDLSEIPDVMKIQDDDLPRNIQLQLLKYGFKEGRLEES